MKILVQKFGGTSVASQEARIAVKDKVQKAVRSGFAPVVVVSAMGRKGEPYATDTLIKVLKETNLSVNVRELDMMMCCGEIMAACVMAATLQKFGINAMALTGGQAGDYYGFSVWCGTDQKYQCQQFASFIGIRRYSYCLRVSGHDGK